MNRELVARGLIAPTAVALLTLLAWIFLGSGWSLVVLAAGAAGIVGFDLRQQHRVAQWAAGPLDAPVPDAPLAWRVTLNTLYRHARTRIAIARDLARTIDRFQKAAEAVPDGMVLLDARNRIRWANRRAGQHLGVVYPGDAGQPVTNLMREPGFARYLETSEWTEPLAAESQREPGVELSIQLVPFGAEERLLISRDVSRIEEAARMRRDFIANVSHELKTPLTVLAGFVETLQDVELDPPQRDRFLQLMHEQTKRMQRLVDDLLALSALESERNRLEETSFPIVPLLRELLAGGKALSKGEHEVSLSIESPAIVHGNREELASAFSNLVSNAVRYTMPGGSIMLAWRIDPDGSGVFAVSDTGIGIALEHLPRLTERFYRVDRSRSRATGGTGLGLAIVKHVLMRHQATLQVDSVPGKGSTFAARLPAQRVEALAEIAPESGIAAGS